MKVIFLDFDGVLNSQGSFLMESRIRKDNKRRIGVTGGVHHTLCHVCTSNLQHVLDTYKEVKIVISSSWRIIHDLDYLKAKLDEYHVDYTRVIGITPKAVLTTVHDRGDRGSEIQAWLKDHPEVRHYVAIDDDDDISYLHGWDRFVKTSWQSGMTYGHALELIEKLSNKHIKKISAPKD